MHTRLSPRNGPAQLGPINVQKRIGDNPVKTRGRLLGQLATTDLLESFFLSFFFYLRATRAEILLAATENF